MHIGTYYKSSNVKKVLKYLVYIKIDLHTLDASPYPTYFNCRKGKKSEINWYMKQAIHDVVVVVVGNTILPLEAIFLRLNP